MPKETDNPVERKFASLKDAGQKHWIAIAENAAEVNDVRTHLRNIILGITLTESQKSEKMFHKVTRQQELLLNLVMECYLYQHLLGIRKNGNANLADQLEHNKPVAEEVYKPILVSNKEFPFLRESNQLEQENISINLIKLLSLFERGRLKLERPADFALMVQWIVAMKTNSVNDSKKISAFELTLGNSLTASPEDIQHIQLVLSKKKSFKVEGSVEPVLAPIRLLQAFWKVFLPALVDPDNPNFDSAHQLLPNLASGIDADTLSPSSAFFLGGLAEALAKRHQSKVSAYKLNSPISLWLIKFSELDEILPREHGDVNKYWIYAVVLGGFIEKFDRNKLMTIVTAQTALQHVTPYQRVVDPLTEILNHPESGAFLFDQEELATSGKLKLLTLDLESSPFEKALAQIDQATTPALEKAWRAAETNKLPYPDILEAYPFLKKQGGTLVISSTELPQIPQLLGENLLRVNLHTKHDQGLSLTLDCEVFFRALKPTDTATEQFFKFTLLCSPEGFDLQSDLLDTGTENDRLDEIQQRVMYIAALELIKSVLSGLQAKFDTTNKTKVPPPNSGFIIKALPQLPRSPLLQRKRKNISEIKATNLAEDRKEIPKEPQHIQVVLLAKPKATEPADLTAFESIDIDPIFDMDDHELVELINEFLDTWNTENQLYKLKTLRSDPSKARLEIFIKGIRARIMLQKRKVDGHTKLFVTEITKRNEKTYK